MNCANDYCLYNNEYECTLEEININSMGACDDCILVNIDKDILEMEKAFQLSKIEEYSNYI